MTQRNQGNTGCFRAFNMIWTIIFLFTLLSLTSINLIFSNIFSETCGYIHPLIFEVQVTVIDDNGFMASSTRAIPNINNEEAQLLIEEGAMSSTLIGSLDTFLRVYNADATVLLDFNDDFEGLTSEIPSFSVEADQTIIIEVATFADSAEGRYSLLIQDIGEAENITASDYDQEPFTGNLIEGETFDVSNLSEGIRSEGNIRQDERIRYTVDIQGGRAYRIDLEAINEFANPDRLATNWSACLEYYGFVSGEDFTINSNGFVWFLTSSLANDVLNTCEADGTFRARLEQCVQASVHVSATGRLIFFVLLAVLVVSLPIFIVDALEGQRETIWYIFLFLVAIQATTTAMLFLHLGEVSGINALAEFGYSIFGGITTGSALVFIERLANRARDH